MQVFRFPSPAINKLSRLMPLGRTSAEELVLTQRFDLFQQMFVFLSSQSTDMIFSVHVFC